ncbi:MAG: cupredoxin domain-containing protein, partial [Methylophagaceae bacterium]
MSKKLYNLVLQEGTDEAAFISTEAAGMEVHDNLSMFDMLLCMRLTEDEAAILESSEKVLEIGPERTVIETISYPSSTPRYEGPTVSYRTKFNPSSGAGAAHTGLNMFFTSEFNTADGTPPFGYFQGAEYQFDDTVKSNFLGEYVDIVAIEAGAPLAGYAGTEDHVDFEEWDTNDSKFIAMDWSAVNGSASSTRNNQITNGSANTFSAHAIGVLSAAGGKYCGWGKKSTLRVMYLSDGVATAYQTVLAWHNAKSVNAETGLKNATIVTGAWGFSGVEHEQFYKIEDIKTFVTYDKDTGATTTHTRPTGTGSAQTITLVASASGSSDYIVNGTDRSGTISGNDPTINAVVGDTITMNNNANGAHPMYFKTAATTGQGQQVSGASGQGSASMSLAPGSAGTYYYICEYHSSMVGQIIVSESQPSGWGDDYSVFADNLAIPRVILDTNGPTIDKWMVSIPDQTRYSTFDTIMSSYASAGGIYHFKSAGNNAHVGVSPEDPRHNNQITIESGSTYVINNPDSNGFNQFSSGSISTDTN